MFDVITIEQLSEPSKSVFMGGEAMRNGTRSLTCHQPNSIFCLAQRVILFLLMA